MGTCASSPIAPAPARHRSQFRNGKCLSNGKHSCSEVGDCQESCKITTTGFLSHSSLVTKQGGKGINQDSAIVWEKLFASSTTTLCGVFDGHGPHGHVVSRHIRDSLPLQLIKSMKEHLHIEKSESIDSKQKQDKEDEDREDEDQQDQLLNHPSSLTYTSTASNLEIEEVQIETTPVYKPVEKNSWIKVISESFKKVDEDMKSLNKAIPKGSGSTAVVALWHGVELTVANLGDSRCVMGRTGPNGLTVPVQLTIDQTPSDPEERKRIEGKGGRVMPLQLTPDIMRVWLPHEDAPGLAMSRAFGDQILKKFGVSNIPSIYCRRLTSADKFIVLATDGVWDVLSNQETVDIVARAFPNEAAMEVVKEARKKWELSYRPGQVDDISVVVLHFPSSWKRLSNPSEDCGNYDHWNWNGH